MSAPSEDVFFTKIEPTTGFMIEQKKNLTVFFSLKQSGCLAFPSLDNLGEQLIPLYDLEDNVSIDKIKFLETFDFVEETL